MAVYGGIESGGTKIVCMVGSGPDDIRCEERFPTTTPQETLARMIAFFQQQARTYSLASLGIGTFGPVDLNPDSPTYGYITTTPKQGWVNTSLLVPLQNALQVPVFIDTDVNAAALGEFFWGAGQRLDPFIYFTIGTGIGAGSIINGKLIHGLTHPETGHIRIPHDWQTDPFAGACPYHGDCFEGLASGEAMNRRWGRPAELLPPGHPAWELEAQYIALAVVSEICALSPRRIVLGGGVMQNPEIFPVVRSKVLELLNGYIQAPAILKYMDRFIVPPALGNRSGVLGAIALAHIGKELLK